MVKKILIAEDEKPMAKALQLKLKKEGFEVKIVFDGQQALALMEKEKFDLLLLDIMMPQVDGFGVLEKIKNKTLKPIVVVTSNLSQEEDIKKAKDLGARDFLVKADNSLNDIIKKIKSY